MKKIEWTDALSVNNFKIDVQHKKLITLINKLIDFREKPNTNDVIGETITELLTYVKIHFHDEEIYLQTFNYPRLIEHREEHRKFSYQISMYTMDVITKKENLLDEMISYLRSWIVNHITIEDQDYKNYLASE